MGSALAAIQLLGGGLSALGELQAGDEAYRTGEANEALLKREAKISLIGLQEQTRDLERRATLVRGETVASAFGSGTTLSGSTAALLAEQAMEVSRDKLRLIFNQQNQAMALQFQAREAKRAGKVARSQSRLSAIGSLLGSTGRALKTGGG